jgi:acyl dehydratase
LETGQEVADIPEGIISSEDLESWINKRMGQKLEIRNIFNTAVTQDSIRHFVDGIGDRNRLFRDPVYAKSSPYGTLPAPSNWLYSVFPTWVMQGLRGVHAFHSGNEWVFHRPILVGDTIKPEIIFAGMEAKKSEFANKIVFTYYKSTFRNQREELVAETYSWSARAERKTARDKGKYSQYVLPHPWTDDELQKIEDEVIAYEPRGSLPRYWEDVRVGDELLALVKGPFGVTDMIAYCVGADPVGIKAFGAALELYRKHPAWSIRDRSTGALEPIYAVHYNKSIANAAGLPMPYDVGAQRHCWLIEFLYGYIGDDGWIRKNYAQYRRFFYLSDAMWLKGKVVKKYLSDDGAEPCVDVETHALNQRGEDIMTGYSTLALPSRDKSYSPVRARLHS